VFSGTDFPDFRIQIPEIRDTFCAFQNFRDFGNPDLKNPVFTETALRSRNFEGFRKFEGFQEISGDLGFYTIVKISGKFRKKPEIQI
jgi:hypothetical protein